MAILRGPAFIVGLRVCVKSSLTECYESIPESPSSAHMTIVKSRPGRAAYGVRDKVKTRRGEGIIKYVYPQGPHGKNAYSVDFGNRPIGVVFSEDEITLVQRSNESF